ncbi:hypothetical protein GCM10022198_14960 [Klugiella xanthotipulae]|uniref:Uncharacterized protein n=1 Tax=Klugiella xanthotipulae TaxID=244735 RepID=A0A543I6I4_9MICO|nr:DUF6578 domain-containing protein [Klugiella xanthotipulae]TQM66213.1 hypothetical protein FB466_1046 [Klugiella xanthotipulae]
MLERILVAGWQLDCCGDAFAVDEVITWSTTAMLPEWSALYSEFGQPVVCAEEHHDDTSTTITGVIRAIHGVKWRYEEREQRVGGSTGRVLTPIPGTGTIFPCDAVSSSGDFADFLVDIETPE